MKKALITGVNGQDGSFLTELLLSKGYEVHGMIRRSSSFNRGRIEHIYLSDFLHDKKGNFKLHYGDLTDSSNVLKLMKFIIWQLNLMLKSHLKSLNIRQMLMH